MTEIYTDVLIVGGGPAGASAALSLLNYSDTKVILVEQSSLDRLRVGEHVSASFFELIKYLKIDPEDFGASNVLPTSGTTSYWGSDLPTTRDSIFTTESSSFQIDREKFELTLVEQIAKRGGKVFPRTKCIEYTQLEDNSWEVLIRHREYGEIVIKSKFLIDATGRQANVCKHVGIYSKKYDELMGVGAFLKFNEGHAVENNQMLEATELGWWYTALLPNKMLTAIFFSDSDIVSKYHLNKKSNWIKLLQETKQVKKRVNGTSSLTANPWIRKAFSHITDSTKKTNFLAIGDAAASFDPISSMGIGFAITSACQAAKVVQNQLSKPCENGVKAYQKDIETNFKNYLKLRERFYQGEKRWMASNFWMRRGPLLPELV